MKKSNFKLIDCKLYYSKIQYFDSILAFFHRIPYYSNNIRYYRSDGIDIDYQQVDKDNLYS